MNITRFAVAVSAVAPSSGAWAQESDARPADLLRQRAAIDAELVVLDSPRARANQSTPPASDVVVTARALSLTRLVAGQTVTNIDDNAFRNTPATTIADIVKLSPGVAVIRGNGPREVSVSVRGSNARNGFGARAMLSATTGSIYAGQPRTVYAGIKTRF